MKKRVIALTAATLAMSMAFTACGGSKPASSAAPAPAAPASSAAPAASSEAPKEAWKPTGTITMLCPFNAGSVGDTFSRPFAEIFSKYAGVNVVVENQGGGSGSVGTQYMLSQPADGSIFSYHSATGSLNIATGSAPYTLDQLQPLASIAADYHVLVVNADSDFKTVQDLVDYAKANPGEFDMAGAQISGINHLFGLYVLKDLGIEGNYIPYDDGASSCLGLLGGNADCLLSTSSTVRGYLESGDFRVLAYTNPDPIDDELLGDAVTFASLGCDHLANYVSFKAVYLNNECSDEIKAWYDDICNKVCNDADWLAFLDLQGNTPAYMGMADFTEYSKAYVQDGAAAFAEAGLQ